MIEHEIAYDGCKFRCYLKEIRGKKQPHFRVFCRKTDPKCQVVASSPSSPITEKKGKSKPKDIFFRGRFLTTTENRNYYNFVQQAKERLSRVVAKRRHLEQGWLYNHLQYLFEEGLITEAERKDGVKSTDRIVYWLEKGI